MSVICHFSIYLTEAGVVHEAGCVLISCCLNLCMFFLSHEEHISYKTLKLNNFYFRNKTLKGFHDSHCTFIL